MSSLIVLVYCVCLLLIVSLAKLWLISICLHRNMKNTFADCYWLCTFIILHRLFCSFFIQRISLTTGFWVFVLSVSCGYTAEVCTGQAACEAVPKNLMKVYGLRWPWIRTGWVMQEHPCLYKLHNIEGINYLQLIFLLLIYSSLFTITVVRYNVIKD